MAVNAKYGTRIKRREDPTLIQGQGRYSDDIKLPGMLSCAFVRAGVAHGTIANVDTSAAKESPGVVAVYTADDLGLNDLPNAGPPVPSPETMRRPILAKDKVRFIGEAIAVVVAETHAQAVDAVDLVEVDIDELPVLVDMTKALEDGAPILFDEAGTNLAAEAPLGAAGALDDAEVKISSRFVNQRLAAVPMEPAAAVAAPDPEIGGVRLWAPLQSPHMGQGALARLAGPGAGEDPRHGPDRRRRVRRPHRHVPRASRAGRDRAQARQARPVRREPLGDHDLDAARSGPGRGRGARRDQGRQAHRHQAAGHRRLRRLSGRRDAHAAAHRPHGVRRLPDPQGRLRVPGGRDEHDTDRRVPRGGSPEAIALLERAMDQLACAGHGPGEAGGTSSSRTPSR